jgi:hypothetical protein
MRGVKKTLLYERWNLQGAMRETKSNKVNCTNVNPVDPPPQVNKSTLLKSSLPESPGMQAIVRPKYALLATKDLRFPIPTSNRMMPFLSSTGRQVTYLFLLLRRASTNRVEKKIFAIPRL